MADKKPTRHRSMDFTDDSVKGGLRDRPETYKASEKRVDVIRILTNPITYYGARVANKADESKGFFALSLADIDDIENNRIDACKKACPLFRHGFKIQRRWVCLIMHVGSVVTKGGQRTVKKVMTPYPMSFGAERYAQIRDIIGLLPKKEDGKARTIRECEIQVTCVDEKYQKLNLNAITEKSMLAGSLKECKEAVADMFDPEGDLNGTCTLLEEFLEAEDFQSLEASIARASGKGGEYDDDIGDSYEDGDEEEKPKGKPAAGKPASGKKPAKPADEDSDLADDIDDILDGDDEDEKPKAKPGKSGGGKPSGKKPAKEAEDSDDDDSDGDD